MGEASDRPVALGGASGLANFELCGAEGEPSELRDLGAEKRSFLSLMKNLRACRELFGTTIADNPSRETLLPMYGSLTR